MGKQVSLVWLLLAPSWNAPLCNVKSWQDPLSCWWTDFQMWEFPPRSFGKICSHFQFRSTQQTCDPAPPCSSPQVCNYIAVWPCDQNPEQGKPPPLEDRLSLVLSLLLKWLLAWWLSMWRTPGRSGKERVIRKVMWEDFSDWDGFEARRETFYVFITLQPPGNSFYFVVILTWIDFHLCKGVSWGVGRLLAF